MRGTKDGVPFPLDPNPEPVPGEGEGDSTVPEDCGAAVEGVFGEGVDWELGGAAVAMWGDFDETGPEVGAIGSGGCDGAMEAATCWILKTQEESS